MKTKIFTLITAVICLCLIFAGCKDEPCKTHVDENADKICDKCGAKIEEETTQKETDTETETEAVCEEHKDENADKLCDNCGKAIVSLIQQIPAEEESYVAPIVNPIPSDANLADYIVTEFTNPSFELSKIDGNITSNRNGDFAVITKTLTDNEVEKTSYKVINLLTGKVILDAGNAYSDAQTGTRYTVDISFNSSYFSVRKDTVISSSATTTDVSYAIYTYAGDMIGTEYRWNQSESEALNIPSVSATSGQNISYVTMNDTTYVINTDTDKVIYNENKDTIVKRPDMDLVQGNVGYTLVSADNTIKIYDLTKWIDCVYTYDIPENAVDLSRFLLANGNMLVQYKIELPYAAVSYDLLEDSTKYDVVYVIIDAAAKKANAVEFGYWVEAANINDGSNPLFTDKVENVFTVKSIENGVMANNMRTLVVGNDLSILCEVMIDTNATLVDKGLYAQRFVFNNNETVIELVDINGVHKGYITNNGQYGYGYKFEGTKYYNYSNELLIDLSGYTGLRSEAAYRILSKDVEDTVDPALTVTKYFYYANGSAESTMQFIGDSNKNYIFNGIYDFDGFVVSYTEGEDAESKTVYELRDINNKVLKKSDYGFSYVTTLSDDSVVVSTQELVEGSATTVYYTVK
ncbi:MAG: hypothetical protein ACI3X1_02335 [Eubacteriales bacterium]